MRKRLWKITDQTRSLRIVFLGEKTYVISDRKHSLEQFVCFGMSPHERQSISKPKGTRQECTLRRRPTIPRGDGISVAKDQAIIREFTHDSFNCGRDAGIVGR